MTRETKVGLVVGTGIILLIGIVVSDHLASQQRGQQQTLAPTGYPDMTNGVTSNNGSTRTIDPRGQSRILTDTQPPVPANPLPHSLDRNNIGNGQRTGIDLAGVTSGTPAPGGIGSTPGATGTGNATTPGTPGTPGTIVDRTPGTSTGSDAVTDQNLPPGFADALRRNNLLPEDNTPRSANPLGTVTDGHRGTNAPRPTEPLIHHVLPGESLWSIAEKFFGDGRYHAEIARANADKLLPGGGVREGVRLVIPNKTIAPPGSAATPGTTGNTTGDRVPPVPPGNNLVPPLVPRDPNIRIIEVKPGEALSIIASRELGSIRHMQQIIDANRDQITDADDIKAGMKLRVPVLPAATTTNTGNTNTAATTTNTGNTNATTPGGTNATNAAPPRSITETSTTRPVARKTHKVQPRDTFTSIARTRLGSDNRWKELYDLNKHQVRDPDSLREGIELILPADAR